MLYVTPPLEGCTRYLVLYAGAAYRLMLVHEDLYYPKGLRVDWFSIPNDTNKISTIKISTSFIYLIMYYGLDITSLQWKYMVFISRRTCGILMPLHNYVQFTFINIITKVMTLIKMKWFYNEVIEGSVIWHNKKKVFPSAISCEFFHYLVHTREQVYISLGLPNYIFDTKHATKLCNMPF